MSTLINAIRCLIGRHRETQPLRTTKTYVLTLNGPIDSRILISIAKKKGV